MIDILATQNPEGDRNSAFGANYCTVANTSIIALF